MKRILLLLLAGLVVMSVSSCRKSVRDEPATHVRGQVFLVLRSGNAVKLALASVNVIPELDALAAAEAAKKQFETSQGLAQGDLSQEISAVTAQLTAKRDALRKRQEQLATEVEAMKAKRDFSPTYSAKSTELNSINAELARNDGLKERAEALRKNREGATINPLSDFAEALLGAAKPVVSTRTNADGEFTFDVSKKAGRVAVLIEASRDVEGVERLVWFAWLDQIIPDSGVYLFSNHNLLSAGSEVKGIDRVSSNHSTSGLPRDMALPMTTKSGFSCCKRAGS